MRGGVGYTLVTAAIALGVGLLGGWWAAESSQSAVWLGVGLAFAVQVAAFWILFVWLLPSRRLLAHGLGVAVRFVAVGGMALLWLPRVGAPAAPVLLALVSVFFASTVLEPLFLQTESTTRR